MDFLRNLEEILDCFKLLRLFAKILSHYTDKTVYYIYWFVNICN